ncbi:MAG: hypothetical protein JWO47_91 [Candidatus Saccharibacteria bacterium]|nr:hypothetical protein [Candidatus Saccharibacteria bacterium]
MFDVSGHERMTHDAILSRTDMAKDFPSANPEVLTQLGSVVAFVTAKFRGEAMPTDTEGVNATVGELGQIVDKLIGR